MYVNRVGEDSFPEREMILLDQAGYTVALNRIVVDTLPPYVPAADRPGLRRLLRRVAADDIVVVLELAALGCSARDVLATLMQCRKARIQVRCLEVGNANLAGQPDGPAAKMLRALVRMEVSIRSLRSKDGLAATLTNGRRTGRPPSLSDQDRLRVMQALRKGLTVSEVARRFGTSRQTVLRIRAAES
ncbi:recombinase family protein [Paraburkholderia sp. LEh10]|nr:recombinase family protein [Paraburkholderia sp. LEh10]